MPDVLGNINLGGKPLHEEVRRRLVKLIHQGEWRQGARLPSEIELSERFGVSRMTVRQALSRLASEGMLVRHQGKGTFVASPTGAPEAAGSRRTISLVMANTLGSFTAQIIAGVEAVVRQRGYELNLMIANDDPDQERQCIDTLIAKRVSGVLLFTVDTQGKAHPNCYHYLRIIEAGIPLLFVDRYLSQLSIGYIVADDEAGMRQLTEHVLELGHTSVGYLDHRINVSSVQDRYRGFLAALLERRLTPELVLRVDAPRGDCDDRELAFRAVREALANGQRMPRALVCCNAYYAIGASQALKEAGLKVPDDVALVGFDDLPEASVMDVPLTVIRVPIRQMGSEAARRLIELIATGRSGADIQLKLPGELVVRESCGTPPDRRHAPHTMTKSIPIYEEIER